MSVITGIERNASRALDFYEVLYCVAHALSRFDTVRFFPMGLCEIRGLLTFPKELGHFKRNRPQEMLETVI